MYVSMCWCAQTSRKCEIIKVIGIFYTFGFPVKRRFLKNKALFRRDSIGFGRQRFLFFVGIKEKIQFIKC